MVFVIQHSAAALWQPGRRVKGIGLEEVWVTGGSQIHVERTAALEFRMQPIQVIVGFALSRLVGSDQLFSILKITIIGVEKHEYQTDRQGKEGSGHQKVFTLASERRRKRYFPDKYES